MHWDSTWPGPSRAGPGRRANGLAVRSLELTQELVPSLHRGVQSLLGRLRARPNGFQFLVDDVADLNKIAEAHSLGVVGRGLVVHLPDRCVGTRILLVEPLP